METTYSIAQADGAFTTQDREVPKLRKESVPKLLPNCPSYLSSISISSNRIDKGVKDQNRFSMALHQSLEQERTEKGKLTNRPSKTCKIKYILRDCLKIGSYGILMSR